MRLCVYLFGGSGMPKLKINNTLTPAEIYFGTVYDIASDECSCRSLSFEIFQISEQEQWLKHFHLICSVMAYGDDDGTKVENVFYILRVLQMQISVKCDEYARSLCLYSG